MCDALMELMKDELDAREVMGMEKGIEQGIEHSMQALLEAYKDLQLSESQLLDNLVKKLNITEQDAQKYLKMYL